MGDGSAGRPGVAARTRAGGPVTAAGARGTGVWTQLWRGVVAYRLAALAYAGALILANRDEYARPDAALAVLAAMAGWTALLTVANSRDRGRVWPVVVADHVVCVLATLASVPVQGTDRIEADTPTLPTSWAASPVLGSALLGGPVGGLVGALVQAAASVATRRDLTLATLGNVVLLLLAGTVGGYVARLVVDAERRLAGEQELALRGLVTAPTPIPDPAAERRRRRTPGPGGTAEPVDLRSLLAVERSATVTVSAPAEPVPLPAPVAAELAAAVRAALDNVARHAGPGARAWVLVEDLGAEVVVGVRDDGVGIPPGRLERAAAEGRLGVAASLRGRLAELGGTMAVVSAPGEGTEVELRVPRGGSR